MTKNEVLTYVAAIVTTLDETNGSPEGIIYTAMGMNLRDYETVRGILIDAKLVTVKGFYMTLTDEGKETAKKLNAAITK